MTTKRKRRVETPPASGARAPSDPTEVGSFPISTRLSETQKQWVEAAATLRGWTPANFVRQAAVEKAVHVLNTSRRNRFDFEEVAHDVAKRLCKPEARLFDESQGFSVPFDHPDLDTLPYSAVVEELSAAQLQKIREAARLGGAEFLALIVEYCTKTLETRANLPEPIEPGP